MATRAAAARGELDVWDEFGSQRQQETSQEEADEVQASRAPAQLLCSYCGLDRAVQSASRSKAKQGPGDPARQQLPLNRWTAAFPAPPAHLPPQLPIAQEPLCRAALWRSSGWPHWRSGAKEQRARV